MKYDASLDKICAYGHEIKARVNGSYAREEFITEYAEALISSCKSLAHDYKSFNFAQGVSPINDFGAHRSYNNFANHAGTVEENLKGLVGAIYGSEEKIEGLHAKAVKAGHQSGRNGYKHKLELPKNMLQDESVVANAPEKMTEQILEAFPYQGFVPKKERRNYSAHFGGDAMMNREGRTYVLSDCEDNPGMKVKDFMSQELGTYFGVVENVLATIAKRHGNPSLMQRTSEDKETNERISSGRAIRRNVGRAAAGLGIVGTLVGGIMLGENYKLKGEQVAEAEMVQRLVSEAFIDSAEGQIKNIGKGTFYEIKSSLLERADHLTMGKGFEEYINSVSDPNRFSSDQETTDYVKEFLKSREEYANNLSALEYSAKTGEEAISSLHALTKVLEQEKELIEDSKEIVARLHRP